MAKAKSAVAARIKAALEASGIGTNGLDRALGKKAGYTSTMVNRGSEPLLTQAQLIAAALDVRLEWLATGEGAMRAGTPAPSSAVVSTARLPFYLLPGWEEAEKEARTRYAHVPEYAWAGARELTGDASLGYVAPETVLAFAMAWAAAAPPPARPQSQPNNLRLVR